jgi:regulator of sirC expression with transglutaminase-like and TPR domain
MQQPTLCRPHAFHYFKRQIAVLDTTAGLLNASIAVAMHALDDVEPGDVDNQLRSIAQRVSARVRSRSSTARLAHLHDVLFDEGGFRGNQDDYYNPLNSYLPSVLEQRSGIPITLSLVYKVVAERLELAVEGVNAPGHFLVRVMTDDGWMLVDPFYGGGVLTDEEAFERMEQVTGRPVPRSARYLGKASHSQWLSRMLVNLQHIFAVRDRRHDLVAMSELQSLLDQSLRDEG